MTIATVRPTRASVSAAPRPGGPPARSRRTASGRRRRRAPAPPPSPPRGSSSPNSTTSGFTAPRQLRARATPSSSNSPSTCSRDSSRRSRCSSSVSMLPWTSITPPRARLAMQPVDVLRDHRLEHAAPLELRQRLVRRVRLHVAERLETRPVEAPEPRRIATEGVDRGDLHRIHLLPDPRPGERKSGIPDGTEIRRPVSATVRRDAASISSAELLAAASGRSRRASHGGRASGVRARPHLPFHFGLRFPRKAAIPSRASSEPNAVTKPPFSASMPSSRSPLRRHLLDLLDRQRRLPGELSRPRRAPCRTARGRARPRWRARSRRPAQRRSGRPAGSSRAPCASPTRRGSRCVPPKPGMIPRLISGWPKLADSAAIRKSHAIDSSQPPPKAMRVDRRDRRPCSSCSMPRITPWPESSSSCPASGRSSS